MSKFSKVLKAGAVAAFVTVIAGSSVFAAKSLTSCVNENSNGGLKITNQATGDYTVKCPLVKDLNGNSVQAYGKKSSDCTTLMNWSTNAETCESSDLNSIVKMIINAVIFIIGIIAVIMVILGGVTYATSQGDSGKVKKGKDTILYGIIGLVVALLAFAIVNFVLNALQG